MADDSSPTTLQPGVETLGYDETLMYGQYTRDLGVFARQEAQRVKLKKKTYSSKQKSEGFQQYTKGKCQECKRRSIWLKDIVVSKIGEDWIFLTMLGIIMALLSFLMDYIIDKLQNARRWSFQELESSVWLQYISWVVFPLVLICFSTGFVHIVGPNAIGSGIPEMKTIMRGVVLKEYLTFRTLIAKIVGLCTSLGCGIPIGKEGPFVHVASITATLLGKLLSSFHGIYENESRNSEMLAAACAVGVACTFAAPIGGVLFSIEVTATYFAVRNYWRGFYAAVIGALVFRLLAIWFKDEETLTALFKTSFREDFPFDPVELFAFLITGIVCGFGGALFVYTHRQFVEFIRKQKRVTNFLQRNRFIFPSVVVFLMSSLSFPPGFGQYMAGMLSNHQAVNELFSNFTWSAAEAETVEQKEVLDHWMGPLDNIYVTLLLFVVMRFWMCALATTLPVPAGVFMPVFTLGAAFGRLMGEGMAAWFPDGFNGNPVLPGGYAIVGAAALSGSVTHTISTSVIVFELTGQMGHVLPCVIAVLVSNAIAHVLQPSFYDSLIQLKKLPFLPDIINRDAVNAHRVFVEDFMVRDVMTLSLSSTFFEASQLLTQNKFRSFPLVESKETMMLLGSIQRPELERMVHAQIHEDKMWNHFLKMHVESEGHPRLSDDGQHRIDVYPVNEAAQGDAPPVHHKSILKKADEEHHHSSAKVQFQQAPATSFQLQITPQQQVAWENEELRQTINYDECQIDPAPFQLVEKTSLYKVHSVFSLLSIHHAYVTTTGRLVGIVGLKEVRNAVQGHVTPPDDPGHAPPPSADTSFSEEDGITLQDMAAASQA